MKPEIVISHRAKEVIVKGGDVDLTILPLFLHHDRDGNAFFQDLNFISADPDTDNHRRTFHRQIREPVGRMRQRWVSPVMSMFSSFLARNIER